MPHVTESTVALTHSRHALLWDRLFIRPEYLQGPAALFGVFDIRFGEEYFSPWWQLSLAGNFRKVRHLLTGQPTRLPSDYRCVDLVALLNRRGIENVSTIDYFDARADCRWDMNAPVDRECWGRYGTFIDFGSIEHVFDTRQCLENCLRLLRLGGYYLLSVPVNGYFAHGLHVFNPRGLLDALALNGFTAVSVEYTLKSGKPVDGPDRRRDVLMWLVAQKRREMDRFVCPQQSYWADYYQDSDLRRRAHAQRAYWSSVGMKNTPP